jgi:AN1-type zinc finger protein 5/6
MDNHKQLERNCSTSSLNSTQKTNINFDKVDLNEIRNEDKVQKVNHSCTIGLEKKKIVENNEYSKSASSTKGKNKNKKKCFTCNKKIGLLGFECKCKNMFCSMHLNPESHNCNYDFKKEQKDRLEKQLVKVVNDKVIRI